MASFLTDARGLIHPDRESEQGPLGLLLLSLTFTTGLVDSFSYLVLGHVFVGNQTGNFVLLGLALAGAPGFSVTAQSASLVSFAVGTLIGGRIRVGRSDHRGKYLFAAAGGEVAFLLVGVVLAAFTRDPAAGGYRYSLIFTLAMAMGIQTATARKLAVPDLTTTTFTQLITATFTDSLLAGGKGSRIGRRIMPFAAILAGAFVGTLFVVAGNVVLPLLTASLVSAAVTLTAGYLRRSTGRWVKFSN